MVTIGDTFEKGNIIVKLVEVSPYFNPNKRRSLLIGYWIIQDGEFKGLGHIAMLYHDDINKKIDEVVKHFNATYPNLTRGINWIPPLRM